MNKLTCIKCQASYDSEDIDPYYCSSCEVEKKRIAAEIDAKMAGRPKKPVVSRFSQKDFQGKNGRIFFNAKDLML